MKKLFILFILFILTSCSTSSDGGLNFGMKGSQKWHETSSDTDKQEFYSKIDISELCKRFKKANDDMLDTTNKYAYNTDQKRQLQTMRGLEIKGYHKNYCGKPNLKKFTRLEDRWVNVKTNEYDTPKAKQAFTICDAQGDLVEIQAKNRQVSLNNQQKGTGIALSIVQGLNVAAAGNDAYQSVLKGCMAEKGYLKQKIRITVD